MSALPITSLIRITQEIDELRKESNKAIRMQQAIIQQATDHTAQEFLSATRKVEELNAQRKELEENLEGLFADAVSNAIDSLIAQGRLSNVAMHARAEG